MEICVPKYQVLQNVRVGPDTPGIGHVVILGTYKVIKLSNGSDIVTFTEVPNMCPAAAAPSRTYQGWTKLSGMDRKMLKGMPHVE